MTMYFRVNRRVQIVLICALGFLLPPPVPASADLASSKCEIGPWAQGLKVGPRMDASGRILRSCVFVGLDLRNANFEGADLGGCEFYQCDLRNASFKNAIFTGLLWGDCRIDGADFTDAVINGYHNIHGIMGCIRFTIEQFVSTRSYKTKRLKDCIIAITSKSRSDFTIPYFDFRKANLTNAIFVSVNLTQCDFTDATITGMGVNGGRLSFKQISSTRNYRDANLCGLGVGGVNILGVWNLSGMNLTNASFNGAGFLANVDLTDAIITNCSFRCSVTRKQLFTTRNYKEGHLSNIRIWNVNFNGADFSGINLTGCRFYDCNFTNASFNDTVISGVTFSGFNTRDNMTGLTLDQIKSTWNYKNNRMEGITSPATRTGKE